MYKGNKSLIVKIGVYSFLGLLVLVIIVTFTLPTDWMSGLKKQDPNIIARVNGESIERLDLTRLVDRMMGDKRQEVPPQQLDYFLSMLINDKLMTQYALKAGVDASDDRVIETLRRYFTDPQTNRFNDKMFKSALQRVNLSVSKAIEQEKSRLLQTELDKMFAQAAQPTKDEVLFQTAVEKGSFQIRYAFLSNEDLKKKNAVAMTVTDAEIDAEMNANKKEIENPATDRAKFKDRIIDKKMQEAKKSIIAAIDQVASKGESFDKAAAVLAGKTGLSEVFKAGEQIKEQGKAGKPLYSVADSEIFRNDFANLKEGASSRAIVAADGIYIFTPAKKDFKVAMPAEKDYKAAVDKIAQQRKQGMQTEVFTPFMDNSKIERYNRQQQQ